MRRYGERPALDGATFKLAAGRTLVVFGPNGAGKSTLLRVLATLLRPHGGSASVLGHDVRREGWAVRGRIGFLGHDPLLYGDLTATENLDYHARLHGLRDPRERIAELLALAGLERRSGDRVHTYSRGMVQRLAVCRAVLHDPDVLLLDEPAAGLDPKARVEFKRLVRLLAADGKTLLVSSHILSELEETCDSLLFIVEGRIVHHGSAAALKTATDAGVVVAVQVMGEADALRAFARRSPGLEVVDAIPHGLRLRFESGEPDFLADMLARMVREGIRVVDFRREERRLEDAFIDVLRATGTR